jgi:hypothetical protein
VVLITLFDRKKILVLITLASILFIHSVLGVPILGEMSYPRLGVWPHDHTVKVYSNGFWNLMVIEYEDHVVKNKDTETGRYNMTFDFDYIVHEVRLERTYTPTDETPYCILEVYRGNELIWRESMDGDEIIYKNHPQMYEFSPQNNGPPIEWIQRMDGQWFEFSYSVIQTSDGGYLSIGYNSPFFYKPRDDAYLVKTDPNGALEWNETIGGPFDDHAFSGLETEDGNYLIAGRIKDTGKAPNVYLTLVDKSGEFVWSSIIPSRNSDEFTSFTETGDGYLLTGYHIEENHADYNALLIKTDLEGELIWRKTFGDSGFEEINSISRTVDGYYVLVGTEEHEFYDPTPNAYGTPAVNNVILFLVDGYGNVIWKKDIGGWGFHRGNSVFQTQDGGFIIAGSYSDESSYSHYDALLAKTDENGELVWSRTYGGPRQDMFSDVIQTEDGGYLAVGSTLSFGEGGFDVFVVKTDGYGNHLWSKNIGESNHEKAECVRQTRDGGFIISGHGMPEERDVYNVLLIKLAREEEATQNWLLNELQN